MEDNTIIIPEPARTHLVILGKEYEVVLIFSIHDNEALSQINTDQDEICIQFIKDLVCRHIVGDIKIESSAIPDESCVEYIDLFLLSDAATDSVFKSLDESLHPCRRFLLAQKELMNQMLENLRPTLSGITELIQGIFESYTKNIKPIVDSIQSIVDQYTDVYEKLINGISDQIKEFIDVFANINIPQLTEEDKRQIINRHILWDDYGWTCTDFLSEELMDHQPVDISDANKIAKKLFNKQGVAKLFEQMELLGSIKIQISLNCEAVIIAGIIKPVSLSPLQ